MNRNIRNIFYSLLVIFSKIYSLYFNSFLLLWWFDASLTARPLQGFTVASTVESVFVQMAFKLFDCVNAFSKI